MSHLSLVVLVAYVSVCCGWDVEIAALGERLSRAKDVLRSYEQRLKEREEKIRENQFTIQTLIELNEEQEEALLPIAFTAHARLQRNYESGDVIEFPLIRTNHGFNYDASGSVFTCPYDGIYLFSSTLYVELDNDIQADISQNGTALVRIRAADTLQSDQATNIALTECKEGEEVTVVCAEDGTLEGFAEPVALTTFSGFLVIRT